MHTQSQATTCAFVRNLTFQTDDLGKEATLVLMFHTNMDCTYQKSFPVIWRTTTFGEEGRYSMHATYTNQLAFSRVQVEDGNVVNTETCVHINDGQKTTLTRTDGDFQFSVPKHGVPGYLEVCNDTGFVQDIAISIITPGDSKPKPVICLKDVGDDSEVKTKFTPKLHAYISSDHQETSILEGAICTDSIWEQDLAKLPECTTLTLSREPATGHYTITQEGVI
ncbi:hypothetical protein EDB19DRAFT_1742884 [Suillus lakei]|nr:hypothetical protein EDB19DRAFT_1742884 [Suillus lakei]